MSFCSKLLVSTGRCLNVIIIILSLCLYGVGIKILSNVGSPLLSLAVANFFCGTESTLSALLSIYTLTRRNTFGFSLSKSIGFVNILMWFALSLAHYVTRNFKILQASNPNEFQTLMRVTLYGCLVACATQLQIFIVSLILTCTNKTRDYSREDLYQTGRVTRPRDDIKLTINSSDML